MNGIEDSSGLLLKCDWRTNASSKNVQNHEAAVSLFYMDYNFARIHQTLRINPAVAAGATERLWDIADIVALLEKTLN
jgi:hypothetical protein